MSNPHAIVIMYDGKKLPDQVMIDLITVLVTNHITIPESVTAKYMDENGLRDILVRNVAINTQVEESIALQEPIKQALIYIGKRFEASLTNANRDLTGFAIELYNAASVMPQEEPLLTAMEIISSKISVNIPISMVKKYHFTPSVINVIKRVYSMCPHVPR